MLTRAALRTRPAMRLGSAPTQQLRQASRTTGPFGPVSETKGAGAAAAKRARARALGVSTSAAALTAGALWFAFSLYPRGAASSSPIQNEVAKSVHSEGDIAVTDMTQQDQMRARAKRQGVYAWGSNRYNVVAPDSPQTTIVRTPRSIPYFDGVALRDLVLEEKHGVAVDANGDVLQWGLGFFDETSRSADPEAVPLGRRRDRTSANQLAPLGANQGLAPVRTLVGKDIVKVTASDLKVYALSRKGEVFVFSAVQALQRPAQSQGGWSTNPLSLFGALSSANIDHERLVAAPSAAFQRGEKITDIVSGSNHLLALSTRGRTFSVPIDEKANVYGQMGVRRVLLNAPATPDSKATHTETILEPRMLAEVDNPRAPPNASLLPSWALPPGVPESNPSSKPVAPTLPTTPSDPPPRPASLTEPPTSIRFCTTLHEVPALRNVPIAQLAAGTEHSIARTTDGRVLGWGRHTHGQVGLGAQLAVECVPVPSEIVLARSFPSSSVDVRCTDIAAGGDNTFFMTTRREPGALGVGLKVDVLAVGKGQFGTLGNAMWSQVQSAPVRVKTVSGLMEYSEQTNSTHPVPIYSLSIGRPGHVAIVLDTVECAGHAAFGRDVMVWGSNIGCQLGNGKRSNLAVPQHLPPLPPPTSAAALLPGSTTETAALEAMGPGQPGPAGKDARAKLAEADLNGGALTHMPYNRLQLASRTKADTRTPPNKDGKQGSVRKGVQLEEVVTAGAVSTAVYWKVDA